MANVLDRYFILLSYKSDNVAFRKFQDLLDKSEKSVSNTSSSIVNAVAKIGFGVVGAFVAVSGAVVGMADEVAMADQRYRLLGLRMMMTTDSARKMDIITKTLGASLGEIFRDPELHARAIQLSEDMDVLGRGLGGDFESNMRKIRDIRAEFGRLSVSLQFITMGVVNDLFIKLGLGDFQTKMHEWIDYLNSNSGTIANTIATTLVPVLRTTWDLFVSLYNMSRQFALAFSNIIGLITGDKGITESTSNWEKFSLAVQHVVHWMKELVDAVTSVLTLITGVTKGLNDLSPDIGSDTGNFQKGVEILHSFNKDNPPTAAKLGGAGKLLLEGSVGEKSYHDFGGVGKGFVSGLATPTALKWAGMMSPIPGSYHLAKAAADWLNKSNRPSEFSGPPISDNSPFVDRLFEAMKNVEGFYPGSKAYKNNNPDNLMFVGQEGATKDPTSGLAVFSTLEAGKAAAKRQILLDIMRGRGGDKAPINTLADLITSWANPKAPGNTPEATHNYIDRVSKELGIDPNANLKELLNASLTNPSESGSPVTINQTVNITKPNSSVADFQAATQKHFEEASVKASKVIQSNIRQMAPQF